LGFKNKQSKIMESKEWIIAATTLLGPVLAVQAQKAIERARESRNRKSWVFHSLMATRAARVSADHVQALNMIDLVFYGTQFLGIHRRKKSEQGVLDAWREYHDHLGDRAENNSMELWHTRGEELFVNLLYAMADDVGYKFDRVQLKKGAYSPIAHGELEEEQALVRKGVIKVLSGEAPLKMNISDFPINQEALAAQVELQRNLNNALSGDRALRVEVTNGKSDQA
ncbi:DUF6680 family protein, partial [Halomonas sp. AOP27-A1-34]|uniref:DUF6680 family protein n=2 Tax=unclassified Halomonas TaxID=2609666 RepID=UPI0040334D22